MVGVVISIAAKVAELLVVPIGKHICYPFKYKSNITELKKQVEKLKNQKDIVQHRIDEARGQGNEILKFVEEWMNRVDEFTDGVVKPLIDGEDDANKQCFVGLCNNLMITRYSLSKKAVKMTKDGINLLKDGKFDVVGYCPALERTTSIYIEGYQDFDSRKPLVNDLMEALKNPDANLIGVYGMGGVGKTTLVKRAADQAVKDKLFDVVVIVELKEIPNIKNIQEQIADRLGLTLNEETLEGRAARIRHTLRKEKRVLIVLDNIWSKLNLHAVGIPINEEERGSNLQEEDRKGRNDGRGQCKVLLTSRSEAVLSSHMNTTKNILVQILDDQEAGDLFWKIVGDSAKNFDFEPIGVEIVKYCAGLPVAITTIASALKNKSVFDWKYGLDQLRRSNPRHFKEMEATVYSAIKLSYDFLESKEEKSLFLLCSLYNAGEDIIIEQLLRYSMGLCLFENVYTLEQGRNRLYILINKLKASSLLLDGYSNRHVKMHKVTHAVGVSIASTDELMFNIPDDTDVKEMLEEKLSKDSIAVSLPFKNVSVLPERLEFRKLKLLFLFMDELSLEISDVFFEGMKEIKVLDLVRIRISSLPPSLCVLTNLQTLCLEECELVNIAMIGELKTLEILCLWSSDIEQLPKEIGQLTRLRLLDLSTCSNLKVISPNVIPSLTRLEELYMGNGFIQWESEGQSNAKLSDLKHLSHLTTLEIHVLDARIMPEDLFFEKLHRYKILIGGVWEWSDDYESSRMMKLKLNNPVYLGEGVKGLLNTTEDLYLDELKGVKNILYQLNEEGFPQLKNLHVQNGLEMQYVIDSIEWGRGNVFPRLESLFLHNLLNLEKICHGQLSEGSFNKLRILQVQKCDRLKHLFSFSMASDLFHLQEIEVTNCEKLEEILLKESEEVLVHRNENIRRIQLTQLHSLTLQCLPQLTSFVLHGFTPDIGSQEIVAEDEGFMPHFSQNVVLPSLKNLKLFSIKIQCKWLDELPVMTSCCQALTNLMLEECNGLRFLFSYSMVKSLVLLQKLEIRNCQLIEEIINTEALRGQEKMIEMVFPKLISLHLKGLPKLTQFSSGNLVEFPSLTELSIKECPKLKTSFCASTSSNVKQNEEVEETNRQDDILPFFEEKVVLPTLTSLNLSSIRIQTIWHNQIQAMSSSYFRNLTEIMIDGCDTLKYAFSSSMVSSLIQLTVLEIINCKFMENVIITREERISNILFPKLFRLHLKRLPELTSFCTFAGPVGLPSLTELWLQNCPRMLTFVSEFLQTDMPGNKEEQMNSKENQHSQMPALFDEKVHIPKLKFLRIDKVDNMRKIWHHQLALDSFSKMDSFELYECHNLLSIFPSNMLGRLQKLEELWAERCDSLETIFEIVAKEDDVVAVPARIVFPQLTWLELSNLPSLRSFYQGSYILEWPKLKLLSIWRCNKVEILTSDFLSLQETHRDNQLQNTIQEPLFVVDKDAHSSVLADQKIRRLEALNSEAQRSAIFRDQDKMTYATSGNLKEQKEAVAATITRAQQDADHVSASTTETVAEDEMVVPLKTDTLPIDECGTQQTSETEGKLMVQVAGNVKTISDKNKRKLPIHESEFKTVPSQTEGESKINVKQSVKPAGPVATSIAGPCDTTAAEPVIGFPPREKDEILATTEAVTLISFDSKGDEWLLESGLDVKSSIKRTVLKIIGCMSDVKAGKIGVHGIGGIGKTSVLKALISYPKIKGIFDLIILVSVSRYWSVKKIQNEVIKQLSLSREDSETDSQFAKKLFEVLSGKKFLLLLDNVWECIDFKAVGIPDPVSENGCKIVVASSKLNVCYDMDVIRVIEVETMSKEEAYELFSEQVGRVSASPDIQPFAHAIVKGCGGLPLLTIVTGRALTEENNVTVWEHASKKFQLTGTATTYDAEDVIQLLKFSFDRLTDYDMQSCFLYCCLFSEDKEIRIVEFIEHCIQEGLIDGRWGCAHKRGLDIVDVLVRAFLVEVTEGGDTIKMHDSIRDLALGILSSVAEGRPYLLRAYSRLREPLNPGSSLSFRSLESPKNSRLLIPEGPQCILRAAAGLTEPPLEEEWKQARMIFLMDNNLRTLPERPNCPKLLTLFLQRNYQLRVIPPSFFGLMTSLKVLNLSKTRVKSLPEALFQLKDLQVLILRDCERLVMLPPAVGCLKCLEVLDLQGTEINKLPNEIGKLALLRHLKVSFYGSIDHSEYFELPHELISGGILSSLHALETLSIAVHPGDQRWYEDVKSVITDISNLTELTSLCFQFPQVEHLELFLEKRTAWNAQHLTEFKFVVGHQVKSITSRVPNHVEFDYSQQGQCLRFVNGERIPDAILKILAHSSAFFLDHHLDICSLSDFGVTNINGLKLCIISECPRIEKVVDSRNLTTTLFPCLERLSIHHLWNLTCIWEGIVPEGSFAALKLLSVCACPKLKYVFSSSMIQFVPNLEELAVEDCPAIEDIVLEGEIIDSDAILLPNLKKLTLHYLPGLVDIWKSAWPSLEHVSFYNCPRLKNIGIDSRSIREIKAEKSWWDELEWEDTAVQLHLQKSLSIIHEDDL